MDAALRRQLEKELAEVDEHETRGPRLLDDARRLFGRARKLVSLNVLKTEPDLIALELACFALQLPLRQPKLGSGKLGKPNLKGRAEAAAELLVTLLEDDASDELTTLLDRTTRLLHEVWQKLPMLEEARLLADAVNLDDFGVSGLLHLFVPITQQGGGVPQLIDAIEKRDQYGYWDSRLKEGFHFDATKTLAKQRLERARNVIEELQSESKDDQP